MESLHHLLAFVQAQNEAVVEEVELGIKPEGGLDGETWTLLTHLPRLLLGCAHQTPSVDAETALLDVIQLFERIIAGKVPIVQRAEKRGEMFCLWREAKGRNGGEVRFAVGAPERLREEVRRMRETVGWAKGEKVEKREKGRNWRLW